MPSDSTGVLQLLQVRDQSSLGKIRRVAQRANDLTISRAAVGAITSQLLIERFDFTLIVQERQNRDDLIRFGFAQLLLKRCIDRR